MAHPEGILFLEMLAATENTFPDRPLRARPEPQIDKKEETKWQ
jgi:hypothetical protein